LIWFVPVIDVCYACMTDMVRCPRAVPIRLS